MLDGVRKFLAPKESGGRGPDVSSIRMNLGRLTMALIVLTAALPVAAEEKGDTDTPEDPLDALRASMEGESSFDRNKVGMALQVADGLKPGARFTPDSLRALEELRPDLIIYLGEKISQADHLYTRLMIMGGPGRIDQAELTALQHDIADLMQEIEQELGVVVVLSGSIYLTLGQFTESPEGEAARASWDNAPSDPKGEESTDQGDNPDDDPSFDRVALLASINRDLARLERFIGELERIRRQLRAANPMFLKPTGG